MATAEDEIRERLGRLTERQLRDVLNYVLPMVGEPVRGMSGKEWLEGIPLISPEFARELRMSLAESRRMPGREDTLLKWALGEDADEQKPHSADPDDR